MSQNHAIMASRYELKYLIPNSVALKARAFIRQHLDLDEFGVGQPDASYPVHSLYLDSDDWKIYWCAFNGDRNRFKLRVRYYNDSADTPVFFEIKRREKDVILKQRCGVRRAAAAGVLAGHLPDRSGMIAPDDPAEQKAIQDFLHLQFGMGAVGKMQVSYLREAYVNDYNNEVRVTFDRSVRVEPRFDGRLTSKMESPLVCTGEGTAPDDLVILELKFTERFPNWYHDLVRTFHLTQTGAAKYVEGTTIYAGRHLHSRDVIRNMVL
jgi:hypothetical protein